MALSSDSRLRDALLFAALGLVPAALLTVLGLRAIGNEDAAVRRAAQQRLETTASRLEAAVAAGLEAAAGELAALEPGALPESEAAFGALVGTRLSVPAGAELVSFGLATAPVAPRAPGGQPQDQVGYDACVALGRELPAAATDFTARCREARDATGRWVFPVFALALPGSDTLAAWLETHAALLSPVERAVLAEDARALDDTAERAAVADALARTSHARSSPEARRAAEPGARGWPDARGLVTWSEAGSRGVLRVVDRGRAFGFVVHRGALEAALRARSLELPDDVAASFGSEAREPRALATIAPDLAVGLGMAHTGALEARAQARRALVAAAFGGALAVLLALGIFLALRLRRLRRTSELRTDFVATVAHELRTPIASVRMLAELLEEGRVPDDERDEVHAALGREARRLSTTVERLLELRRAFAPNKKAVRVPTDVAALVAEAVEAFEERHPDMAPVERDLALATAPVDAGALRLALDNLLENARKHAPEGTPYAVRLRRTGGELRLEVTDRGPGIGERDQARIFAPFERADERLSRATEGFGIGLALVRHAAESHGGTVELDSAPGRGAAFSLRIPVPRETRRGNEPEERP
ncbi:MAG: HAMP domain-containing histidine kinase [Myxococcales bacterium]|nr:HAMP domain-containing histidine kinase [Myxococcales bacterium]